MTGLPSRAQQPTAQQPAAQQPTECKTDAGGITLSPGFCATVFADHLGHARHLAVAANRVAHVNTWSGRYCHNDTPPPGGSPDQVTLCDRIFHGQAAGGTCAGCHGADAMGSAVGSNLANGKWEWSNGSVQGITQTIERGVPKPKDHTGAMPPMGGVQLSQADVAAVADYAWALGHRNES